MIFLLGLIIGAAVGLMGAVFCHAASRNEDCEECLGRRGFLRVVK